MNDAVDSLVVSLAKTSKLRAFVSLSL